MFNGEQQESVIHPALIDVLNHRDPCISSALLRQDNRQVFRFNISF